MPRQATRSAGRGPLDKLRGPVRKMAEEVFSIDGDRAVLKDEPLLNGLSELQTKQALKVLDTYCANVQRQGSGRIQNKAAYLMSLIQSSKLGPAAGTPGSVQRLIERLSPAVRRAVDAVFDPVVDRVVLEDRALMELLAKVPEEQALAALKKYRATVQRRGRDAIDNRCGYLIGFLKQYQDGVAVVGVPGNAAHQSRNAAVMAPSSEGLSPPNPATALSSSANGHATSQNGSTSRNAAIHGSGGPPQQATGLSSSQATAAANSGAIGNCHASGVRPISYLEAPVRKQLEKLFESGKDKAVLEDVGLIKQLARLGEEQALAALKNYKEASKHRRDINNKSAYLMGILRGYIEGTTPIAKAPWEGGTSEDGPDSAASSAAPAPPAAPGPGGNRTRGRGRGSGPIVDDAKRNAPPNPTPSPGVHGPPPPTPPPPQPPQSPAMAPAALALEMPRPRELGGFANAPVEQPPQQLQASNGQSHPVPLKEVSGTPSTSPMTSPPLGGGGLFLDGIGQNGVGVNPVHHTASTANQTSITGNADMYDPSNSLLYLDGGGGVNGFGTQAHPTAHQQPPRHASPHESLFGHSLSVDHQLGQQPQQRQTLVGPGLLGGDFLSTGGGIERGLVLGGTSAPAAAPVVSHAGGPRSHSNPGLFGSGLLAGDEFGSCSNGGLGNTVPASPGSGSGLGSTSGLGSSSLSGTGSGAESPLSSDAGNDVHPLGSSSSVAAVVQAGSLSMGGTSSYTGSTDWPSSSSPRSGEGRENLQSSSDDVVVSGMIDMLARLNLSKYVPVLAEAEVDMDALRLFGEDDLKDLGFPKGPRIKLLHEVQNLNFTPRA